MELVQGQGGENAERGGTFQEHAPVMLAFAPNWPVRVVMLRVFGTAFMLAAASMWLLPVGGADGSLTVIKLGISVFFFFCGLALLMRNHQHAQPDAYFDPIRREVRVLQKNDRGRPQTILRRGYDSLGSVRFASNSVQLVDVDGSVLMRLVIDDANARAALKSQLSGMVTIVE